MHPADHAGPCRQEVAARADGVMRKQCGPCKLMVQQRHSVTDEQGIIQTSSFEDQMTA